MGRVHKKDLELYGLTKEDAYNKKNGESELKQKLPTPASSVVFPKNKMEIVVVFKKKKKKKKKRKEKKRKKELLHLCSKNVQFIFNGEIYSDRFCSYGLSYWLCSFMVELEKILIPKLNKEVKSWRLLMVPFVLLKWIN